MTLGRELRALNAMDDFGSWMMTLGHELRVLNTMNDFGLQGEPKRNGKKKKGDLKMDRK